jgi:hypothetical protein
VDPAKKTDSVIASMPLVAPAEFPDFMVKPTVF